MIAAFITLSKFLQRKARAKPKKPDLQAPGRPKIQQKNAALAALRLPAPDGHGHRTPGPQACKPGWLRWTRRALPESVPHWPGRPADGPCLLRAQLFCAMRLRRSSAGFFLPVNPSVIADSARFHFGSGCQLGALSRLCTRHTFRGISPAKRVCVRPCESVRF